MPAFHQLLGACSGSPRMVGWTRHGFAACAHDVKLLAALAKVPFKGLARHRAAPEWQPLLAQAQPNPLWAHPLAQVWQDADGLRRGSPNTTLWGHGEELSSLLSPGPYQLHSFRSTKDRQLASLELKVGHWLAPPKGRWDMACSQFRTVSGPHTLPCAC